MSQDISEEFLYDISRTSSAAKFEPTEWAVDIAINNMPFLLRVNNENQYQRETAQYKKDQFDNSVEPGEQSLSGWWIRSQTSFHNGSGIDFYEPGTDYEHTTHRFKESRGVDVWSYGEAKLLKEVFHAYTGTHGINAATGNDGTNDVLVSGDSNGVLKKITLNGNSTATTVNYTAPSSSYLDDHSGTNYPIYSVATDGSTYYAVCPLCVHKGTIGTSNSDDIFFKHSSAANSKVVVKYAKGYIFISTGRQIGVLDTTASATSATHTTGAIDTLSNYRNHINANWQWTDITAGPGPVFFAGNGGNNGEVWMAKYDDAANQIGMADSIMVMSTPDGELINSIKYYLGYLVLGTTKGIRICPIDAYYSTPTLGPLLVETSYGVNGFTERGTYIYAATKVDAGSNKNGVLIRIDLTQQFNDGTFAWAYDLEYQSALASENSECTEVYNLNNRLVMVIEEDSTSGELQVEHTTNYRADGWLRTGAIRFATTEPKYFKYLTVDGNIGTGDSIGIKTIDSKGNEYDIITLTDTNVSESVALNYPSGKQESLAFKFILTNGSPATSYPTIFSYQVKAIPAVKRQRLYQYPLSCFNTEMDRNNVMIGYIGRAYDTVTQLEELETIGDFVSVKDYRTDEAYQGLIEEIRFLNESSPDKNNDGFGGTILITIRKL